MYARDKLNGFEYPPGNRLAVNFIDDGEDRTRYVVSHTHLFIFLIHKTAHNNGKVQTGNAAIEEEERSCFLFFSPSRKQHRGRAPQSSTLFSLRQHPVLSLLFKVKRFNHC